MIESSSLSREDQKNKACAWSSRPTCCRLLQLYAAVSKPTKALKMLTIVHRHLASVLPYIIWRWITRRRAGMFMH